MNAKQRQAFDRLYRLEMSAGCPIDGDFELGVLRRYMESAYEAGIRHERQRVKSIKERHKKCTPQKN